MVHQLDVKSAFINSELKEETYVGQAQVLGKKNEEEKYVLIEEGFVQKRASIAWY